MQRTLFSAALLLMSIFAQAQNPRVSASQSDRQAAQERLEERRRNFTTGRQLLLEKHVPFDPDEILRDDWTQNLRKALDTIPEMHKVKHETAPLKGAYLADTLYLPEKVKLAGHTVILAKYVVFEGKNPVIRGNYDIHFFPAGPTVVLGKTLAETLEKQRLFLNVKLGAEVLPSFAMLQEIIPAKGPVITIDTSGPEPEPRKRQPRGSNVNLQRAAWSGVRATLVQLPECKTGCDKSGNPGASGASGIPGGPGTNGITPPNAPDGNCTSPTTGSNNGAPGEQATDGARGENGTDGLPGGRGGDAGIINGRVDDNDTNQYNFFANGGAGGLGGEGGNGGLGGNGGNGGKGGNGVACGCELGTGGQAGGAGTGGDGGNGGNGANGGDGGNGAAIVVSLPFNSPGAKTSNFAGAGGMAGGGGLGRSSGVGGLAGVPGSGAAACGQKAPDGFEFLKGSPGNTGVAGQSGANGQPGAAGPVPSVTLRPGPSGGGSGSSGGGNCTPDPNNPIVRQADPNDPPPPCTVSPILIDTEGEGFHLTSVFTGVTFDITGTNHPMQMAWTDAGYHNAFLALPGADGLVHNGKELFGNYTPQPQSQHPNGFLALAQFDKPESGGNGDGMIDEQDAVFSRLRLWIDENHDGISQPNELHRLPELGIYSLALSYVESRRTDGFGNAFRYKARLNPGERRDPRDQTASGDPGRWAYDVFFVAR